MRVFVNGEAKEFERDSLSLKELLEELGYKEGFAVALNETFVLKSKYDTTLVKNEDRVDIVAPVQGG
ncbi:MAG: sulfur carrier protein ThiS [Epsilonproteobacteria bacterium]|jgi:sulfur carrier protein|nr:sulfur carrier protein ThiS [Campylobacterota bacterium]